MSLQYCLRQGALKQAAASGMDYSGLAKNIADKFPQLSPQLQLAARHVLDRPDDVALMSMRGLAANAGVHPSTMVRLARALTFSSYNDFRATFQHRLRSHPSDFTGRAQELQARVGGQSATVVGDVLDAAVGNLGESFGANATDRFVSCAEAIAGGQQLFVAGQRSCFSVAHYFHYVYSMFRTNSLLLDGHGGTFADRMRGFGKGDVLFAISFEPYSQQTVQAVEYAMDIGGDAVVLTDSMVSPLVSKAEHALIIKNESPSFFQSVASAMAAVEALIALMVLGDGKAALSAIEHSEEQLQRFDAYWNRPQDSRRAGRRPAR